MSVIRKREIRGSSLVRRGSGDLSDKLLTEEDLAALKACADEKNWDLFISRYGGSRLDRLHSNLVFENCDYIHNGPEVLIELKVIETEFGKTEQFREKARVLARKIQRKWGKSPLSLDPDVQLDYLKNFIGLFRAPLARIVKKANRQIRTTKTELSLSDHKGVLVLVNDNFKELPPRLVLSTLGRILNGAYSSIDAVVYLTNHYVVIPGDEYGRILWAPLYSPDAPGWLVDFIDDLGKHWFDYCESNGVSSDDRQAGPDISVEGARAAGSKFPIS